MCGVSQAAVTSVVITGAHASPVVGDKYMGLFATSLDPIGGVVGATTVNSGSSQTIMQETSAFGPPFNIVAPPQGRVTTSVNSVTATGFSLSVLAQAVEQTGGPNSGPAWNKVQITINLDSAADISFSAFQIVTPDVGTSTFTYVNTGALMNAGSVLTNVSGQQVFLASIYSKGTDQIGLSTTVNVGAPTGGSGVVPEPASCAIFGALGLGALVARRRRVSK
jgi:MYXO-CTERM domain-containing protein